MDSFLRSKVRNFKSPAKWDGVRKPAKRNGAGYIKFYKKIIDHPVCYLTGRKIDLSKPSKYSLDHIIPVSKGGGSSLSNCGLALKNANMAKSDMTLTEFISLCRDIVNNMDR